MKNQSADVIVVGCGVAGLSAAVAARQGGASVIVLERAPIEERGGNSRYTGAWFRMASEHAVSDDFIDHFTENSGPPIAPALLHKTSESTEHWPGILRAMSFVDPDIVTTLAEAAAPTVKWLSSFRVQFHRLEVPFPTSVQPRMAPSGGGLAIIEALATEFERLGGRIDYDIAARELLQDDQGAITGVACTAKGNRRVDYHGASVILGSGGFQGNAEMMTRYIGPRSVHLGMMSQGCHYNKGEGIQMALQIGAAPCGDFGSWHASPMDPRSSRPGASVYIYPYGILVNKHGRRFIDEAPGPTDETYENIARTINAQPGGIAYVLLDADGLDIPHKAAAMRSDQPPCQAQTIAQLAQNLGLPVAETLRTVEDFNRACPTGTYQPTALDGLKTTGLDIPKSNWSRRLLKPPFHAWPIISSIVFTFGGLRVKQPRAGRQHPGRPHSRPLCRRRNHGHLLQRLHRRHLGAESRRLRAHRRHRRRPPQHPRRRVATIPIT